MMRRMARNTDMQEEIRRNAIQATEHLAEYPMSDLYSYLEDAGLVVPPPILQIGGAIAQLRNAHEGSSESYHLSCRTQHSAIPRMENMQARQEQVEKLQTPNISKNNLPKSVRSWGCRLLIRRAMIMKQNEVVMTFST